MMCSSCTLPPPPVSAFLAFAVALAGGQGGVWWRGFLCCSRFVFLLLLVEALGYLVGVIEATPRAAA